MGGYLAYTEYKDSGIEWLGKIPTHWDVIALRYACEFLNRKRIPLSSEERGLMSERFYPYYGASGIIDYVENFIFEEPTVLIAEDGANLLSRSTPLAFIAKNRYWVNNHAHILKPLQGPFEYWANLLCTIEYDPWITGAAQPKLTKENLGSIKLPLPSVEEQRSIARFLDYKTAQIDALIAKKEELLEKLAEKRTALISQAVTRGLDPTVPMKNSGVEWLGEIPRHWKAIKLRYCSEFVTSGSRGWSQYFSDDGSIFLRIANVSRQGIQLRLDDVQRVTPPRGTEGERAKAIPGDVIISITADLGSVAVIPNVFETAYVSQHLALLRPLVDMASGCWISYQILSHIGKTQLLSSGYGGTKIQLSLTDIKDLWLTLPPRPEQQVIERYLENVINTIEQMEGKVQQAIDKLKEYRTALITNAVTGKIDVRDIKLPELNPVEAA